MEETDKKLARNAIFKMTAFFRLRQIETIFTIDLLRTRSDFFKVVAATEKA